MTSNVLVLLKEIEFVFLIFVQATDKEGFVKSSCYKDSPLNNCTDLLEDVTLNSTTIFRTRRKEIASSDITVRMSDEKGINKCHILQENICYPIFVEKSTFLHEDVIASSDITITISDERGIEKCHVLQENICYPIFVEKSGFEHSFTGIEPVQYIDDCNIIMINNETVCYDQCDSVEDYFVKYHPDTVKTYSQGYVNFHRIKKFHAQNPGYDNIYGDFCLDILMKTFQHFPLKKQRRCNTMLSAVFLNRTFVPVKDPLKSRLEEVIENEEEILILLLPYST